MVVELEKEDGTHTQISKILPYKCDVAWAYNGKSILRKYAFGNIFKPFYTYLARWRTMLTSSLVE